MSTAGRRFIGHRCGTRHLWSRLNAAAQRLGLQTRCSHRRRTPESTPTGTANEASWSLLKDDLVGHRSRSRSRHARRNPKATAGDHHLDQRELAYRPPENSPTEIHRPPGDRWLRPSRPAPPKSRRLARRIVRFRLHPKPLTPKSRRLASDHSVSTHPRAPHPKSRRLPGESFGFDSSPAPHPKIPPPPGRSFGFDYIAAGISQNPAGSPGESFTENPAGSPGRSFLQNPAARPADHSASTTSRLALPESRPLARRIIHRKSRRSPGDHSASTTSAAQPFQNPPASGESFTQIPPACPAIIRFRPSGRLPESAGLPGGSFAKSRGARRIIHRKSRRLARRIITAKSRRLAIIHTKSRRRSFTAKSRRHGDHRFRFTSAAPIPRNPAGLPGESFVSNRGSAFPESRRLARRIIPAKSASSPGGSVFSFGLHPRLALQRSRRLPGRSFSFD